MTPLVRAERQLRGAAPRGSSRVVVVIVVDRYGADRWQAVRDGQVVGRLGAMVRPDRRTFVFFDTVAEDVLGPLVNRAVAEFGGDLRAEADEEDVDVQRILAARGFAVGRREHRYLVPTDWSAGLALPDGFGVISAADADERRWRELDDALRQEVPGTDGWRNDPAGFAREALDDPQFDPASYLIAVAERSGEYVGLVRVWRRPDTPRLGLIGVLPPYQRRGLGVALLARAFDVLRQRGRAEVSCEVDRTNTASNALMRRLGARRVGGQVELVRARPGHHGGWPLSVH